MTETYDILSKGGILMIPILLCSVIALALFFERLWALRRVKILPEVFLQRVSRLIHTGQFDKATELCERSDSSVARVLLGGLKHAGKERAHIKEVMEEVGRREATYMERGLGVMGTIASISPLLGLLGTVTGMIRVFQRVVSQNTASQVNASALANGIWEALITTAAGLAVAIPVFVLYKYLTSRVDGFLVQMEEQGLELAESMVGEDFRSPGATPDTTPQESQKPAPEAKA